MLFDLRYALRVFRRRPSFAAVAIVTLGLGIGATAVVASVLDAVVVRALPYPAADRLVLLWSRWTAFDKTWLSELEFFDHQRESRALQHVGAWTDTAVNLTGRGAPERVNAARASASLFAALGSPPLLGRTFTPDEDRPGHDAVAVLGHALWTRRYAADPGIVGATIEVDGTARTVVGVMPAGFMLPLDFTRPDPTQLWLPLAIDTAEASRGSHYLYAVARVKPGETLDRAKLDVSATAARHVAAGEYDLRMRYEAFGVGVEDEILGPVRPALGLVAIAVALLVLIACANVANLYLVQSDGRQREMAVRTAIGAGRRALVRQVLAEGVVLSACGALLGTALAWGVIRLVAAWPLPSIPRLSQVTLDGTVLGFTVAVTVVVGLLVSLVPAWRASRMDITRALHDGAPAGAGPSRQRLRSGLVVAQIAVAVMLVSAAALVLQSLLALQRIDPGFRADHVLTARVSLPQAAYPDATGVTAFYQRLLERLRSMPGIAAAGAVRSLPLADPIGDFGLVIEGLEGDGAQRAKGDWQIATDGSFEAMGERLVRGRLFGPADTASAPLIAVVNETMAKTYWPGQDPLGRRFRVGRRDGRPWVTVVGVVGDVRHNGITGIVKEKFYVPHAQWNAATGSVVRSLVLTVRTASDPLGFVDALRREVGTLDPQIPVAEVRTMQEVLANTTATPRFAGSVLGTFAAIALVLAAVGVYGVLSYVVSRRTREIGVRMALGAEPNRVRRMVLGQALRWGVGGSVLGILLAVLGTGILRSVVYGVSATDPVTFCVVLVTLVAVTGAAAAVPARRATRVDPITCLKAD